MAHKIGHFTRISNIYIICHVFQRILEKIFIVIYNTMTKLYVFIECIYKYMTNDIYIWNSGKISYLMAGVSQTGIC